MPDSPRFASCTPQEWPALLAELDAAFVTGRGRETSITRRYPLLMTPTPWAAFRVLRAAGMVVSALGVREFDWYDTEQRWRGAMIGFVHTTPAARGQGHAARLLDATLQALKETGVDFAVLWSGLPGFYVKLGWTRHDCGVLASLTLAGSPAPLPPTVAASADWSALEALRVSQPQPHLLRDAAAWAGLPLPAATLGVITTGLPLSGYALVGASGDTRYVFETVGRAADFPALWSGICAGARQVYVNEVDGSEFHSWLLSQTQALCTGQTLAHWRMLSDRAARAPWRTWHLPWFDRI